MKLICYLSNGYPNIEASIKTAKNYVESGCDMIEIDFPSRNPYLEGEFISERMAKALSVCSDYERYMEGILQIKNENPNTRFIVLAYENTIEEIGIERFVQFLKDNQLEDMIYVGEKHDHFKQKLIANDIKVSCYVRYRLPQQEVNAALAANGFVYMQAKPGNDDVNPRYPKLKDCIRHLRDLGIKREIYAGVGIATAEDVLMAKEAGADGVFVGSRILRLHRDVLALKKAIGELKEAAIDK